MTMNLLLTGALLLLVSGVPGLLLSRASGLGERIALLLVAAGTVCGLTGVAGVLRSPVPLLLHLPWSMPGGSLSLSADGVALIFLLPIFIISFCGALYGLGYWKQAEHQRNGRKLRFCYGLLAGSMALVVLAANAVLFIIVWELMALAGYFLITTEDDKEPVRKAGYVYFAATHLGTAALLVMFVLLGQTTGSLDFVKPQSLDGTAPLAGLIFFLALLGFGSKAGFMPLHLWLPGGHGSAPSHVSAILSGVMIKTGIYGIVRVAGFYTAPPAWWGWLLLVIGTISGVMGVAYAIAQHDLKRLLAYHSVENIGIIGIGLGLALIGRSYHLPLLTGLGLAGALLHVINHSLFKSLLFYTAGAVIHATGTQEIDRYGGLIKSMPKTAVLFVGAAVAICGLPPLNGFVSEWLIYLGFFQAVQHSSIGVALSAMFAPALALIGGLAVACFVKVFGITFLGNPRTEAARHGHEAPASMWLSMSLILLFCCLLGLIPWVVQPLLRRAILDWGTELHTAAATFAVARLPWLSIAASVLLLVLLLLFGWLNWQRHRYPQQRGATWGCGYQFATERMQYTASSFADTLVSLFSWGLWPQKHDCKVLGTMPTESHFSSHTPDLVLDRMVLPLSTHIAQACRWLRRQLQQGIIGIYLLYMGLAVAGLLALSSLLGGAQ
ncbi:hydrogenase [Geothermobacter hydrogeniphilus]|uniref:Hydrogenase n=1 Tax=Geothermobacter hydrogeniphilus TaxID=1969733 RepID=A0A2K2H9S7_9BACT|nr:proton-conducting transporter membrane subunit [Geothermobacter hydrogeniphilus]PNU19990.1 hydrogenase [Geothermobacter hydrogeniphilus]